MRRPRIVTFAVAILLATSGFTQGPLTATAPDVAQASLGGRLETVDGTRVLHLFGDERERGFAEGYLCEREILECFEEFALGHVVAGRAKAWDLVVRPAVRLRFEFPDEARNWADAVAHGVRTARVGRGERAWLASLGREFDAFDVLACATIPDLAGFLCSSFAAHGSATESGDVLVGRNLDYPSTPALERHSMVFVRAPLGDRAGWVGVGWPGSPGCLTGLSDRGVFVALHDVDVEGPRSQRADEDRRITPRVIALQHLVEGLTPGSQIVGDALGSLRSKRFVMGGNLLLAWQSAHEVDVRGAVVFELLGREDQTEGVTARTPYDDATWIACSNHHRERGGDGRECGRYRTLAEGAAAGRLDFDRAFELIGRSGMSITLYRCVADLGTLRLGVERHTDEGWQPRVIVSVPTD